MCIADASLEGGEVVFSQILRRGFYIISHVVGLNMVGDEVFASSNDLFINTIETTLDPLDKIVYIALEIIRILA